MGLRQVSLSGPENRSRQVTWGTERKGADTQRKEPSSAATGRPARLAEQLTTEPGPSRAKPVEIGWDEKLGAIL